MVDQHELLLGKDRYQNYAFLSYWQLMASKIISCSQRRAYSNINKVTWTFVKVWQLYGHFLGPQVSSSSLTAISCNSFTCFFFQSDRGKSTGVYSHIGKSDRGKSTGVYSHIGKSDRGKSTGVYSHIGKSDRGKSSGFYSNIGKSDRGARASTAT